MKTLNILDIFLNKIHWETYSNAMHFAYFWKILKKYIFIYILEIIVVNSNLNFEKIFENSKEYINFTVRKLFKNKKNYKFLYNNF